MNSEKRGNIIITGGTSGLGKALVNIFLEENWNVATLGRRSVELEKLRVENHGKGLLALQCDIRVDTQVSNFIEIVREKLGTVDVCILNAGTLGPSKLPEISQLELIDLRMAFETNFFANFSLLKGVLKLRNKKQIIAHITSDAVEGVYPGWGAYGASKVAMDFIISTLQKESKTADIVAFSFDPGDMDTEMHRLAIPEDSGLKDPKDSARELHERISNLMEGIR